MYADEIQGRTRQQRWRMAARGAHSATLVICISSVGLSAAQRCLQVGAGGGLDREHDLFVHHVRHLQHMVVRAHLCSASHPVDSKVLDLRQYGSCMSRFREGV